MTEREALGASKSRKSEYFLYSIVMLMYRKRKGRYVLKKSLTRFTQLPTSFATRFTTSFTSFT